jgi:HD-like signal output (HDOD) protein
MAPVLHRAERRNVAVSGIYAKVYQEIVSGKVRLPGLPDVALKVRRAIGDESNDLHSIARILQADPNLSAHLMRVANSPLYRTRVPAEDVRSAVRTFGMDGTGNIVTSHILRSLFRSRSPTVRTLLSDIWKGSARIAAVSAVLGRKCPGFDADTAMLAGLLQNIGALPLLGQLDKQGARDLDVAAMRELVDEFSAVVGALLLESWGFDDGVIDVARRRDAYAFDPEAPADLADLILIARLHCHAESPRDGLTLPAIDEVSAYAKLPLGQLSERKTLVMLDKAAAEIDGLNSIFTG